MKKAMRILLFIMIVLSCIDVAIAEDNKQHSVILGQTVNGDAGVYAFTMQELIIDSISIGYVDADFGVNRFGKNHIAYNSCVLKKKGEEFDAGCLQWIIYDLDLRKKYTLIDELPGLDLYLSTPAFNWPNIAYIGKALAEKNAGYDCIVYNWITRKVAKSIRLIDDKSNFGTDFPGLFPAPHFIENGSKVLCKFEDIGNGITYNAEINP